MEMRAAKRPGGLWKHGSRVSESNGNVVLKGLRYRPQSVPPLWSCVPSLAAIYSTSPTTFKLMVTFVQACVLKIVAS